MKILFVLSFSLILLGAGCSSDSSSYSGVSGKSNTREAREPENPYSNGSGHYAGFEWAERTGGSCSGNSQSFNEGCEEYYSQLGR